MKAKTSKLTDHLTLYIEPEMSQKLDRAWLQARQLTGQKISKSQIINAALDIIVNEFLDKQENSVLARVFKKK